MKPKHPTQSPLDDTELDQLEEALAQLGDSAMNLEMMDGFYCSLISAPTVTMPQEYLPLVTGEDGAFESETHAQQFLTLSMRHWNHIADRLLSTLSQESFYMPVLFENEDGIVMGNDWAEGFMRGIALRPDDWSELLDDEENGGALIPIMMLAHEHDPDPELRPDPIDNEHREKIVAGMIAGLKHIYQYFEDARLVSIPPSQTVVGGPKIGRNDPCPCGSGKKHKKCCGDPARSVH